MAQSASTPAPATPAGKAGGGFVKRELNGATFLTLEHVAHMVLVVVVPMLVLAGVMSALNLWFGWGGVTHLMMGNISSFPAEPTMKAAEAVLAIGVVAALLVLVPPLVVLDRRTRAEWQKRTGYAGRLAYKVPVYSALAVLGVVKVVAFIQMLYVVIASLAFIGVPYAPIGSMYLDSFLPSALTFVTAAGAAWYVFKLAKGRDNGRLFSMAMALLGAALVVALLITSIITLHSKSIETMPNDYNTPSYTTPPSTYDDKYYEDLLNKYAQ